MMTTYAIIAADGSVVNLQDVEPGAGLTIVDVTNVVPQPGPGWSTPDEGQTWVQPAPGNLQAAQATGQAAVQELATTIGEQLAQAQADAATIASWAATQTVFPAPVMAAIERAGPAGWVNLLGGIANWLNATYSTVGLTVPAPTT